MVRLNRTRADTFAYYARSRVTKAIGAAGLLAAVVVGGVWQYPNASAAIEEWAAGISGRDSVLTAQAELSDALAHASSIRVSVPAGAAIDTNELAKLVAECEDVRAGGESGPMLECAMKVKTATRAVAGRVERYQNATQILALEQQASDAARQREEAARAEAQRAADEQATRDAIARAEEEARRAAEQDQGGSTSDSGGSSGGNSGGGSPGGGSGGGGGSTLSTTVTCNSRQTVTAIASGGGTVTVTISGAGSHSASGGGSASASASGQGTFHISATSSEGGLTLNPSWTGACF